MDKYLDIANGSLFYICGILITIFVFLQAFLFYRHAYKEGLKCGLAKEQMTKAFRTGFVSSIVPSIASVVALAAMVPVLGLPIPWIRQTIMGSTAYELLASGIGAKSMGISKLGGQGYTAQVFASSIWIMTLGSIWAVIILVFFLKMIKSKFTKLTSTNSDWKAVLVNAAFLGVFSIFIAEPFTTGGIPLATLAAGGIFMTIFALLIFKFKISWLKEYSLTFSMLGAMACAGLLSYML